METWKTVPAVKVGKKAVVKAAYFIKENLIWLAFLRADSIVVAIAVWQWKLRVDLPLNVC